ncbi:MAG: hypothetical protein Ct9H300mP29_7020 [Candidatus Neomarinimicrobiota bacterium]|nr:MAG: hypothetical protein Ct9H300mP29_7020 [Candidatus Neomarinimicrobiota bacterium]
MIAAGSASFVAGKLGDKFGHKTSMMLAYLGHFIAVLLAIFAQNMFWVYGIFIAIGVGQGAFMPSAMNLVYDFANDRDTKTYMALVDSFLAPFVLLFIMGIGALVQGSNYTISLCILGTSIILGMLIYNSSFVTQNVQRKLLSCRWIFFLIFHKVKPKIHDLL